MPYERAFSSLGCPELALDEVLALAGRHGLAAVELRALGGTVDLPAYLTGGFGTPAGLAEHVRGSAVRIVAIDTSFKLVGATPAEREAFLFVLPWAEALGGLRLRVFDGGQGWGEAELAEAVATMQWWRELRSQCAWRSEIMIETHDSLFTAAAINRFLAAVPDATMLWDTHHTWKRGGEDPVATWRSIAARVAHIHIKDSISRPSAKHPYTYVLPGDGEFPMAPLRAVLTAEYSGPLSLEWEKLWHPYLPPLDDALAAAERWRWW